MSKGVRQRPARLGEKLRHIRESLGLSQSEMLKRLGFEDVISYTKISHYELGIREPTLPILLSYAQVANVYVDALIDDAVDLPERLPSVKKSDGLERKTLSRRKHSS
jgi:transcriptional regulator with XRE-family HTH domain